MVQKAKQLMSDKYVTIPHVMWGGGKEFLQLALNLIPHAAQIIQLIKNNCLLKWVHLNSGNEIFLSEELNKF